MRISSTRKFLSQTLAMALLSGVITAATAGVFQQIWQAGQGRQVRIAERVIARDLSMSKRTVRRHLKRLVDAELLHIEREKRRANKYTPLCESSHVMQLIAERCVSAPAARMYVDLARGQTPLLAARSIRRHVTELRRAGLVDRFNRVV